MAPSGNVVGDRLIVQVEASGLYGYLDGEEEVTWGDLTDEDTGVNGLILLLEAADAGAN